MTDPGSDERTVAATSGFALATDTLAELLARVEGATGPDREIDAALFQQFAGGVFWPKTAPLWEGRRGFLTPRQFTASLDAALALVERVLPGHEYMFNSEEGRTVFHATLYVEPKRWFAYAKTPALALLASLLRALAEKEGR